MNYWITTHWPPHEKDFEGDFYYGVWIQDGKQQAAAGMKRGDLVFKYETKTGLPRIVKRPSGRTVTQRSDNGHMGIVALMELTSDLNDYKDSEPIQYSDGTQKWWRYHADAVCKDDSGFLALTDLNPLLGYSAQYRLRGFGDANSGLKLISKAIFDQILAAFSQGVRRS